MHVVSIYIYQTLKSLTISIINVIPDHHLFPLGFCISIHIRDGSSHMWPVAPNPCPVPYLPVLHVLIFNSLTLPLAHYRQKYCHMDVQYYRSYIYGLMMCVGNDWPVLLVVAQNSAVVSDARWNLI